MGYVLKLCGWYPSRVDALSGDFVQRQAIAISGLCKTIVLFAQKDPRLHEHKIETVIFKTGDLFEYRYYYPKRGVMDKLWSQWYYLRIIKLFIPALIKEHGPPSIVHVNIVWRAAIWALYLKKKFGWPFIITEHSTEYQVNAIENIRQKSRSRQLLTRKAFETCRLFIPVSLQLAKRVQQLYGPVPYKVIPNTVDSSLFYCEPKLLPNKLTRLLHISTMGHQKNIEGIVEVLKKLADTSLSFEVILIGPAPERIRKMVAENKLLQQYLKFTGSISYEDVAAFMRSADGLFLFSRYENLPCVILEALCCGVPVVTTDVGGIPEVITKENGILIADGDQDALLKALIKLIEGTHDFDHESIAKLAQELFCYETIGRSFIKAYEQVVPGIPFNNPVEQ